MIDNKKIEEAANLHRFELIASRHGSTLGNPMQCFEEVIDAETDLIENSFITGAKWAINEFIKNLWHPASEEPEKNHFVLFKTAGNSFETEYIGKNDWATIVRCFKVVKWFYVDDLLPKKGGEQ